MSVVGDRLRAARDNKGFKQTQVTAHTGINNKTLSGYENGVSEPDLETLRRLADLYEVSVDWLTGASNIPSPTSALLRWNTAVGKSRAFIDASLAKKRAADRDATSKMVRIPVLGTIQLGINAVAEPEYLGTELEEPEDVGDGDYIYLVCKGDSMINAGIREGMKVLIRRQDWVEPGKIGAVIVNGEEATLKFVDYDVDNEKVILLSANANYPPRPLHESEVRILGQAKAVKWYL